MHVTHSNHRVQHFYLFTDGCPEDRLADTLPDRWHTQAFLGFFAPFSSEKTFQKQLEGNANYRAVMKPFGNLRKWSRTPEYKRQRFLQTLQNFDTSSQPVLNACSFQEFTLRHSYEKLLHALNNSFSGPDIGFEEIVDQKGRKQLRHSYVNCWTGFHVLQRSENQMLILLAIARLVVEQYMFYSKIARSNGYESLQLTVVSDTLAGDNEQSEAAKHLLNFMLDPGLYHDSKSHEQIRLIKSPISDTFNGDLLVDNFAGFVNSLVADADGQLTRNTLLSPPILLGQGWNILTSNAANEPVLNLALQKGKPQIP